MAVDRREALALDLWRQCRRTRQRSGELLTTAFRAGDLRPDEQRQVRILLHALIARELLADRAVGQEASDEIRVLAVRVLSGDLPPGAARARWPRVDWEAVADLPRRVRLLPDPVERLRVLGSLPDWLAAAIHDEHGAEAEALVEAFCAPPPVVLRANTLRSTPDELVVHLAAEGIEARRTRFSPAGVEAFPAAQIFHTRAFAAGSFEAQDEASQMVAEVTAPPPRGLVVDACAGAGGKTLALAALLDNRGTVVALDSHAPRLAELRRRAARAGVANARTILVPADRWPPEVEALIRRADRVLVDAPCSGLGSLRRHPDLRWRVGRDDVARLRSQQVELLGRAVPLLRPGARLAYATCTILRAENESVVDEVRARFPCLEPVRVVEILGKERGLPVSDATGTYLRMLPHRHGSDGFFAAVLRWRA